MAAVVFSLVKRASKDSIELLEWLLQEAREERCPDLCIWFRDPEGHELAAFTGVYRADKAKALMATMRMSKHLTLSHGPCL
jgi:hypothetical protein